jgi:hypothetical protein
MMTIKIIFFIPMFIFGIVFFIWGFYNFNKMRLIEGMPTSKIRSVAMGFVELHGSVKSINQSVLLSPFTVKNCVYYKYIVDEWRSTGKSSSWVTIARDEKRIPFYLQDETGKVKVYPNGAKIEVKKSYQIQSGLGKDPPESVKRFLSSKNLRFEGILFGINKKMRYTEYKIELDDELYILGTAADNPFVSDTTAIKGEDDIIIRKGAHEKKFFISDRSEKQILRSLSISSKAFMIFGAFIAVMSLMVVLI